MAQFKALKPPRTFTLKVSGGDLIIEFPDASPVEVTDGKAAKYLRRIPEHYAEV